MICIAKKNAPFSHQPGMVFVIPHTSWGAEIFPTRLVLMPLKSQQVPPPLDFRLRGPFKDFTVQQDLDRGHLTVWGWSQEGYFRYRIYAQDLCVKLVWEKKPRNDLEDTTLCSCVDLQNPVRERLSLGMHKAQEWSYLKQRLDLKELIPVWLQLARLVPAEEPPALRRGHFLLLDTVKEQMAAGSKEGLLSALTSFFLSAFRGVFFPRLWDDEYQGLADGTGVDERQPLIPLLVESAALIRSFFYRESCDLHAVLLPCLPAVFHCGRMIHVESSLFESLAFEWTKGALRRVQFVSGCEGELVLQLPKGITACRKQGKETVRVSKTGQAFLQVVKGERVHLDRFLF